MTKKDSSSKFLIFPLELTFNLIVFILISPQQQKNINNRFPLNFVFDAFFPLQKIIYFVVSYIINTNVCIYNNCTFNKYIYLLCL